MRLDETTITVSTRPPEGMNPYDGGEYTKQIKWARGVWDEVAGPLSERWNAWLDRENERIKQLVITEGDQEPPRKNHYIPQFWMKQFADDISRVFQFDWDRKGTAKFGKLRGLKGCMFETDLFNVVEPERNKAHATSEYARGRMESDIAPYWKEFAKHGTGYVRENLDIKMMMSEYLARLWHFSPWTIRHSDNIIAEIMQGEKYASLELPAYTSRKVIFDYWDDQIPWAKFHLFARNWTILHTPTPLTLPSFPFIGAGHIVTTPLIWVPLSRRMLLALHWNLKLVPTKRMIYRRFLAHVHNLPKGYRKMIIHPDDKNCWSRAFNRHRGCGADPR